MEKSPNNIPPATNPADATPVAIPADAISVRWWFSAYIIMFATGFVVLWQQLRHNPIATDSWSVFKDSVREATPLIKLLVFGLYQSLACTFLPLNTSWIVSAMAIQSVALTGSEWSTVLLIASVGAFASTVANLNDYHLFTLLLRSPKVAKIRNTRIYRWASAHFDRSPFMMLLLFNLAPIPVDVARMLAASHRYSRKSFAAANFVGRFLRYGIIADVTYRVGEKGWIVPIILIGVAAFIPAVKFLLGKLCKNPSKRMRDHA